MGPLLSLACIGCLLAAASGAAKTDDQPVAVRAFGRDIPLARYLELTPVEQIFVDQATGKAYFGKTSGDAKHLAELSLEAMAGGVPADFASARVLSTVDLSRRHFWGAGYSGVLNRPLVLTDEAGEEKLDLYTVEPDGQFKRLTDVGYIYGWSLSPDGRSIAYAEREGIEYSPGSIRVMVLQSKQERLLFRDSRALRPFWSRPGWHRDGRSFLLVMVADEDRAFQNIALFDATKPGVQEPRLLTDRAIRREVTLPVNPWVDDDRFIYISTESGAHELYLGALAGATQRVVATQDGKPASTPDGAHLAEAAVTRFAGRPVAAVIYKAPLRDVLRVMELPGGQIVFEQETTDELSLASANAGKFILRASSMTRPAELLGLVHETSGFALRTVAAFGKGSSDLLRCTVEKVSYRTFDGLSAPGENGSLHAWLYRPVKPLPPERATLVVEAFYGGGRSFHSIYPVPVPQMFCAAGVHFLSPAPRGSWTMGVEFRQLIRGDLGGAEILDVVEAAKWGHRTLGIPPARIGAFGLSHGGYATMRLLTLPDIVNGVPVNFRLGFGISDAGISNLLRHAASSNVRGWAVDLMGEEPERNPSKWMDRSPEAHPERLDAPLLLLHGSNDIRVHPIESRAMAERGRALGKPVTYVEIAGGGHGTAPFTGLQEYWRSIYKFIEDIAKR